MHRVTNTGEGSYGIYDRHKRLHVISGKKTVTIDLAPEQARRLQARGGKIKVIATGAPEPEAKSRDEEQAELVAHHLMPRPERTVSAEPRTVGASQLADKADEMTFADFREAALPFLGDQVPRSKKGIQDALRAL